MSTALYSFDCIYCCLFLFFFFFQAEDGIRDLTVTGVQTCALPISRHHSGNAAALRRSLRQIGATPTLCVAARDRKSTRLNSSHSQISYAVFCLKKKKKTLHATKS